MFFNLRFLLVGKGRARPSHRSFLLDLFPDFYAAIVVARLRRVIMSTDPS